MRKKKNASYIVAEEPKKQPNTTSTSDVKSDYFKILRYQSKLRDGLLGTFSSDGKYKISDEKILQELVVLPKQFDEKDDEVVYCSSKIGSHILNFKIILKIDSSYCSATLSLIEIEHKLDEDVKHITELANTVEPYSPAFKDNVFKLWKVYVEHDEYEKNDFLETYLTLQKNDFEFSRELTEILSQVYLMRMLKLLDGMGELGDKIKVDYKLFVEKILQTDPSITQDNTRLKRILDNMILKHKAFDIILQMPEGATILSGYTTPLINVFENTAPVKIVDVKKDVEKKVEEKKPAETKPAKKKSKSKGGDSSKAWLFDLGKVPKNDYKVKEPIPKEKVEKQEKTTPKETGPSETLPNTEPTLDQDEEEALKEFLLQQNQAAKSLEENEVEETADTHNIDETKVLNNTVDNTLYK
ncbi:MAG: hypothetical protein ACI4R8_05195 [Candidatus Caccovivens sp.]